MSKNPVIISASRMTDMAAFYPEALINEIETRINKGIKIHTLVIWTKHPQSLFKNPLYTYLHNLLERGVQLFIHLTITGMAGEKVGIGPDNKPLILEPGVPSANKVLEILPEVIDLVQSPDRIRLRIDPIVRIQDCTGFIYSNMSVFEPLVKDCSAIGIRNYSFSFLEKGMHHKVDKRFMDRKISILSPDKDERQEISAYMKDLEIKYQVSISACCVPGLSPSRCIDGYFLQTIHKNKLPVSLKEPKSRPLCGCTDSIDIGGWPPKTCFSGCLYCYTRPKL